MLQKGMNRRVVEPCTDCDPRQFSAPAWQAFVMFTGQALLVPIVKMDRKYLSKGRRPSHFEFPESSESLNKPRSPFWVWSIPAMLDLMGSWCLNIAFTITFASTVQILRNSNIVMCAILQCIYLRRPLHHYQWLGILVISTAMTFAGLGGYYHRDVTSQVTSEWTYLAVIFSLMGTAFASFQMILEESLMTKYFTSPVEAVGIEGIFGMPLALIALSICQATGFEKLPVILHQIRTDRTLLALNLSYFFGVCVFNGVGMCVTKLIGAIQKSILYATRSALVWLIELSLLWMTFDWFNCTGIVFLFIGYLIYTHAAPFNLIPYYKDLMISQAATQFSQRPNDLPMSNHSCTEFCGETHSDRRIHEHAPDTMHMEKKMNAKLSYLPPCPHHHPSPSEYSGQGRLLGSRFTTLETTTDQSEHGEYR